MINIVKPKKIFVALLLIISCQYTLLTQWKKVDGLFGGRIQALTTTGTNILAGTSDGIYLSTNNGDNWTIINSGIGNIYINSFLVNGTDIFAGTNGAGVYLSTDGGTNWSPNNNGLTNLSVQTLAVRGTNIFAGTGGDGVFLSTNNGSDWNPVNNGLANLDVRSIAVSGINILAGTGGGGVFISTNDGGNWTQVNNGLSNLNIRTIASNGANIFVGTAGGGVFLTTDYGANWTQMNNGLLNLDVTSFAVDGTNIFAATWGGGVHVSTDYGTSWLPLNNGLSSLNILSLVIGGSNIFAGTSGAGVFYTSNNGLSWTQKNNGIDALSVNSLLDYGAFTFAGTDGGVFLSTNNGAAWIQQADGLQNYNISSLINSGTNLFAGTTTTGIFLSLDNGSSWTLVNNGLLNFDIRALATNGTNLFAGTAGGGIFLSTDNGSNWSPVNNGLTNTDVRDLAIIGTNIFAGTNGSGVFLSTDNGSNWNQVNNGIPSLDIGAFAVNGTKLYAGTWSSGVSVTTDYGTSWTQINNGLQTTGAISLSLSEPNIFSGTNGSGVYLSTNNGSDWNEINDGIGYKLVLSLAITGSNILAGTESHGARIRPLSEVIYNTYTISGAVSGATNVTFTLSGDKDSAMTSNIYNFTVKEGGNYTITPSKTNYAFVPPSKSFNNISQNETFDFTAIRNTPGKPNLLIVDNDTINFRWYKTGDAETYHIQISTDNGFLDLIYNDSLISDTTRQVSSGFSSNTIYYWRVNARNAGGAGPWSDTSNFTIPSALPPALRLPIDNALNVPIDTALAWHPSTGTVTYHLQVSNYSNFSILVYDDSAFTDTSKTIPGLLNNTLYYWRVNARNIGGAGEWSAARSFTTIIAPADVPVLSLPANNAQNVSLSQALSWNPVNNAVSYHLQVSRFSNFSSFVYDDSAFSETSKTIPGLLNNTIYYWRVNAYNIRGASAWSGVRSFRTIPAIPSAPLLYLPSNNSTDLSILQVLSWNSSTGATSYHLQVSPFSNFSSLVYDDSGFSATSRNLPLLQYNTLYYWRVNAKNVAGASPWSIVWNFRTVIAPPDAPTLASPANSASNISPSTSFSWNTTTTATSYHLQISAFSNFSTIVYDDSNFAEISRYVTGLQNGTLYFWRVNARNAGGASQWSAIRNFTTAVSPPPAPALLAPGNGLTNAPTIPVFIWSQVNGANSYRAQVSTRNDFYTVVYDDSNIITNSKVFPGFLNNTTYYWRANAKNSGGAGPWSNTWSFTTMGVLIPAPVLSFPLNNAIGVPVSPNLGWNAVSGAASYHLQVSRFNNFSSLIYDDSNFNVTSMPITGLLNNTVYYWRVNVRTGDGVGPWSAVWGFTTVPVLPGAPALSLPSYNSVNIQTSPMFSWSQVPGATTYHLQISLYSDFSYLAYEDSGFTESSKTVNGLQNNSVYYWRVNASNIGGAGPWSNTWFFTTVPGVPGIPVLVAPEYNASSVYTSPDLLWQPVGTASSYRLQVSTSSSFFTSIYDDSVLTIPTKRLYGLKNNTVYYWRVNAKNISGTGKWSEIRNFTTIISPPSAPSLSTPENISINLPTLIAVSWNTVSGATSYHLQISSSPNFSGLFYDDSNFVQNSKNITGLQNNITYYWRVNAKNIGGVSPWSDVWNFTTIIAQPGIPVLFSPDNYTRNIPVMPELLWLPVNGGVSYHLQVSAYPNFSSLAYDDSNFIDTKRIVRNLANNTVYFWRVNVKNIGGVSVWSNIRSFTTIVAPPETPALLLPANSSMNVPIAPRFEWNNITLAEKYHLQISEYSDFSYLIFEDESVQNNSRNVTGLRNNTIYFWRVKAKNAGGESYWSSINSFITVIAPPALPLLKSPESSAINLSTSPVLSWYPASGGDYYHLQISLTNDFSALIYDDSNFTATIKEIKGLQNYTAYYWRVNAKNTGGISEWSIIRKFTTKITPIALIYPQNNASDLIINPQLSWKPVSGALSYQLQYSALPDFSVLSGDVLGITGSAIAINGLMNNTTYHWRIRANLPGGASEWSDVWRFTTIIDKPDMPALVSPLNNTKVQSLAALTWKSVNAASSYQIQISLKPDFSSLLLDNNNLTDTRLTYSNLTNNQIYYWRVRAMNIGGMGNWSDIWSFNTIIPKPDAPSLIMPPNNSKKFSISGMLAFSLINNADYYNLQVSTDQNFTTLILDSNKITSNQIKVNLSNNKTYYWRVRGINGGGEGSWSEIWNFTTIIARPNPPKLAGPENNLKNAPVILLFTWILSAEPVIYNLQISSTDNFSSVIFDSGNISDKQATVNNLKNNAKYYWRLRASNEGGISDWSEVRNFTTIIAAPNIPKLQSPSDNSVNIPLNGYLVWDISSDVESYNLQLSEAPDFSKLIYDSAGIRGNNFLPYFLRNSKTYYWRIRSINIGGISEWSKVWNFKTIIARPGIPQLKSPENNATEIFLQPAFEWNILGDADSYQIQIAANESDWNNCILNDTGITVSLYRFKTYLSVNQKYFWRLRAKNYGGYGEWSQVWNFNSLSYPQNYSISTSLQFPVYQNPKDYTSIDFKLFGLPGNCNLPLADIFKGIYEKDWLAFWDNGETNNYMVKYDGSDIFKFTLGKAFWLLNRGPLNISSSVNSANIISGCVEIPLHRGWNIITNPFIKTISWENINKINNDSLQPWIYANGKFEISDKLEPYIGYYYDNRKNLSGLKIPYIPLSLTKIQKNLTASSNEQNPSNWKINISLVSGNIEDNSLWIGVNPDAIDESDGNDFRKPFFSFELPHTVIMQRNWGEHSGRYATDIRKNFNDFKIWDFSVIAKENSILKFTGMEKVPKEFEIYLVDESKGKYVNLRENTKYELKFITNSQFSIIIGKAESVRKILSKIQLPDKFELGRNYPNPFNPKTAIPVKIPQNGDIKIVIYNILGKEVKTVFKGNISAGSYIFEWDGKDNFEKFTSSGVYIYRLESDKIMLSGKMIIMK